MTTNRAAATREYIDRETGELIEGRIQSSQQIAAIEINKEKQRFKERGKSFIAAYMEEIKSASNELSLKDAGILMRLISFMRMGNGGKLINDGKTLSLADIQKAIKKGKSQTSEATKKLEEIGILQSVKVGRSKEFYINEKYLQMGGKLRKEFFTKIYQVHARDIVGDLTLNEAGILFKIIPFFHYQKFVLCGNPHERDTDKLDYLNREELAAAIGIDPDTVTKHTNALRRKGALLSTETLGQKRYFIHPDLMFRKDYEDYDAAAIRSLFDHHA